MKRLSLFTLLIAFLAPLVLPANAQEKSGVAIASSILPVSDATPTSSFPTLASRPAPGDLAVPGNIFGVYNSGKDISFVGFEFIENKLSSTTVLSDMQTQALDLKKFWVRSQEKSSITKGIVPKDLNYNSTLEFQSGKIQWVKAHDSETGEVISGYSVYDLTDTTSAKLSRFKEVQ